MALDLDFSDVTVEDLDDWEEVVSTSIMLRAEKDAAKIDWDAIPPDKLILGTEALSYVSKPRLAKRVKHQELQNVTNCAASWHNYMEKQITVCGLLGPHDCLLQMFQRS